MPIKYLGLIPLMCIMTSQHERSKNLNKWIRELDNPSYLHENPKLVQRVFLKVLSSRHSSPYIQKLIDRVKIGLIKRQDQLLYFEKRAQKTGTSKKQLIDVHIHHTEMVLRFVRKDRSDSLKEEFLRLAMGGFCGEFQFSYRQGLNYFLKEVRSLESGALENLEASLTSIKQAFEDLDQGQQSAESKVIRVVLERVVASVVMFNWAVLSDFYNDGEIVNSRRYPCEGFSTWA